jgi:YfiR/HmsC-like
MCTPGKSVRWLWAIWGLAGIAQAEIVSESKVRAAILLQVANYTEWPAAVFRSVQEPFQFCVMGDSRLALALSEVARDRKVYGHVVTVRQVENVRDLLSCQVVFVRYSRERQIRDIVLAIRSAPVLSVGEAEGFISCGGIMNLAWENGSVRFEINQDSARSAGLAISSRLLRLARLHGVTGDR